MNEIDLKDAIEIARILAKVPEGRLAMILSVFESAGLTIKGLEELEAWMVSGERNAILDIREFIKELTERFADTLVAGEYRIPAAKFSTFCEEKEVSQLAVKAWLAKKNVISVTEENGKTKYSVVKNIEGKSVRCVLLKKDWEEGNDEATQKADP